MTHPRKVRMRTQVRTAHTLSCLLRRGAQPRLSGGAHGAQRHRRVRTPSAHPWGDAAGRPLSGGPVRSAARTERIHLRGCCPTLGGPD